MIARRPADDTLLAVGFAHEAEEVVGAAQFERARALQAFGFEEQPSAQPRVDARIFQQRRAQRHSIEATSSGNDIVKGRQRRRHQATPSKAGS
jgi:hypothetical protein